MNKISFAQFTLAPVEQKLDTLNRLYKKEVEFETEGVSGKFEDMFKKKF